jgi:hypothetical protein
MTFAALALLLLAASAQAADYPLSGEFLNLRSHAHSRQTAIRLGAIGHARQDALPNVDPQATGAVLEVLGDGVLSDAPAIPLPGAKWRALGDPPGSRGYRYYDSASRFGVRKVALRFGTRLSLSISGGGNECPYRMSGVPHAVSVVLHMGDETFCASFGTFERGRSGTMRAARNPAPAACRYDS